MAMTMPARALIRIAAVRAVAEAEAAGAVMGGVPGSDSLRVP
ncbi:hypothetical protein [Streptomyces sp. MJM1172]|nr:hypothetical protein [Streptomyces sp. MJM1172]